MTWTANTKIDRDLSAIQGQLLKRWSSTTRAIDALTDLTVPPIEALTRFHKVVKRMKPVSQAFLLHIGGHLRQAKLDRLEEETTTGRWADDGGRCS